MAADRNPVLGGDAYLHGQSFRPNRSCMKTLSSGIRRIGAGSDATFPEFGVFDKAARSRRPPRGRLRNPLPAPPGAQPLVQRPPYELNFGSGYSVGAGQL